MVEWIPVETSWNDVIEQSSKKRKDKKMLISESLNQAMNAQIGSELGASNQYLMIASYFDSETLPELADFFFRQSDEERSHALKFVRYILDAGGKVEIPAIGEAPAVIASAEAAAKMALDWELEVTTQINNLMDMAIKEGDQVVGNRTRVKVVKNKIAPPFKEAEFDIIYGRGISKEGDILDLGVGLGLVEKSGAWYSFEGERIGQGRENVKRFLNENQDIRDRIGALVVEKTSLKRGEGEGQKPQEQEPKE